MSFWNVSRKDKRFGVEVVDILPLLSSLDTEHFSFITKEINPRVPLFIFLFSHYLGLRTINCLKN